jgi:hypothetical protein
MFDAPTLYISTVENSRLLSGSSRQVVKVTTSVD